jgi:hypothetical protein
MFTCFYVQRRRFSVDSPIWQVTRLRPRASRASSRRNGRRVLAARVNPQDIKTGLDPGACAAVVPGFTGFLLCAEVMPSGEPSGANSLKGEATVGEVTSLGGPETTCSKYNAIGIQACGNGGWGGRWPAVGE